MASLTHALLTEDEAVLLHALEPSANDRVLALFARGNGDAGLALLQAGPTVVFMHDLFDHESLTSQFQLKQWLFRHLDNEKLRTFLAIDEGRQPIDRLAILDEALRELPPPCHEFWHPRRACVRAGMGRNDSTAAWCRTLAKFLAVYEKLPRPLQIASLFAGRCLAPFYFPREEREFSLGYRQLMQAPQSMLNRFTSRADRNLEKLIPYATFQYLSLHGQESIRSDLNRIQLIDQLPAGHGCNKVYLSNIIDYLPEARFLELLRQIAASAKRPCRAFVNSSYDSPEPHPYLRSAEKSGVARIDTGRTNHARSTDRVRAYPGLSIIELI